MAKIVVSNPLFVILAPYLGFALGWQIAEWLK